MAQLKAAQWTAITLCALAPALGVTVFAQSTPIPTGSPGDQRQVYEANLSAVNPAADSNPSGTVRVVIDNNHFGVAIDAQGLVPSVIHMAHIHKGTSCPTLADDTNGDGYVDVVEGLPAYGGILIPLDGDLSTFSAGSSFNPAADANGSLAYIGAGTYNTLLTDLRRTIPAADVGITGLAAGEPLDLANAVVVVHGVSETTTLPSTVQSLPGLTPQQSLPVACGKLVQLSVQPIASPSASPSPSPSPSMSGMPGM